MGCVVCGVWWEGGGGVVRILLSLMGVIRSIYHIEEPKSSYPHPFPQVMNNDQPPFSYLFIYIFFILLFYLFIYSFCNYFFSLRESKGIILPDISGVSSNQPLPALS